MDFHWKSFHRGGGGGGGESSRSGSGSSSSRTFTIKNNWRAMCICVYIMGCLRKGQWINDERAIWCSQGQELTWAGLLHSGGWGLSLSLSVCVRVCSTWSTNGWR